jgi:hypothetical protein
MSDQAWPRDRSTDPEQPTASGVAAGFILFAVIMMIMIGVFQALAGLVAILNNALYVATDTYPFGLNTPTWGWIDLIVGLLVAGAGWAVFSGRTWGRIVGIILAALSAVANFLFIPYYPFWAILIIVLDVFVIWALAVHGREMSCSDRDRRRCRDHDPG